MELGPDKDTNLSESSIPDIFMGTLILRGVNIELN